MRNRHENAVSTKVLYTSSTAAKILGVTSRTIQNWAESGQLKSFRTAGGHLRFSNEDIDVFQAKKSLSKHVGAASTPKAPIGNRLKILIAEDNIALAALYIEMLQKRYPSAEIKSVSNGFDALLTIGSFRPSILISDLDMPELNGVKMLRSIYNSSIALPKHTIVITGLKPAEINAMGGLPAPVKLLHKPVNAKKLMAILDRETKST